MDDLHSAGQALNHPFLRQLDSLFAWLVGAVATSTCGSFLVRKFKLNKLKKSIDINNI